ncbi:MAG: DUF5658 family protein [Phycisphaerales bacterium]
MQARDPVPEPVPLAAPFPALLYGRFYTWYLLAGTLDILVTHFILSQLGGWEVNVLAARLIERYGVWGLVALKYSTVVVVVLVCEYVGRRRPRVGRGLAAAAIVISALPVGLGLLQVAAWTHLF